MHVFDGAQFRIISGYSDTRICKRFNQRKRDERWNVLIERTWNDCAASERSRASDAIKRELLLLQFQLILAKDLSYAPAGHRALTSGQRYRRVL